MAAKDIIPYVLPSVQTAVLRRLKGARVSGKAVGEGRVERVKRDGHEGPLRDHIQKIN